MRDVPKPGGFTSRGREKSVEIDHTDLATKIKQLRKFYGKQLAREWDGERTLGELLEETKSESLTEYVRHHGHKPASEV